VKEIGQVQQVLLRAPFQGKLRIFKKLVLTKVKLLSVGKLHKTMVEYRLLITAFIGTILLDQLQFFFQNQLEVLLLNGQLRVQFLPKILNQELYTHLA
jgi:hypothetical protein